MRQAVLDRFRQALQRRRRGLVDWFNQTDDATGIIVLDGGSGEPVLQDVDHALSRIEAGDFGRCVQCGGEVEVDYLTFDFTACICLDHYSERQKRALEDDLERAARTQQLLLPCCTPALEGVEIAAHLLPAEILSGDYYDFFNCPGHEQGIAIGDVMGKGVAAGMLMASLQTSLRILGEQQLDLNDLAGRLNDLFKHNLRQVSFISLFLASIDTSERMLRYCNAGHHPPLFWDAASRTVEWLGPTGPAIGLVNMPGFASIERRYQSGDALILYTDGLAEARDTGGQEFGVERLTGLLHAHADTSADDLLREIWGALEAHTDGRRYDDTTLIVVRFL